MTVSGQEASTSDPVLVCVECGDENAGEIRGWRAYVFEETLLVYCPRCVEREFEPAD
jgi:hypothetical protein